MKALRFQCFILASALAFPGLILSTRAQATGGEEVIQIEDQGQPTRFVIAKDELSYRLPSGAYVTSRIKESEDANTLRQQARRLSSSSQRKYQLVLYEAGRPRTKFTRRIVTGRILVQFSDQANPDELARRFDLRNRGEIDFAPGHYLFEVSAPEEALTKAGALKTAAGVLKVTPLLARQLQPKSIPNDPLFPQQWHLQNTGQEGGAIGIDAHITDVWDKYTGAGIVIGIVDDGLEYTHPDLASRVNPALQYDFNGDDDDPTPEIDESRGIYDFHGTNVGGVAAASGNNELGVTGAAYEATLAGLRLISGPVTDFEIAQALNYQKQEIDIKNNSWGPADEGNTVLGPGSASQNALRTSIRDGRGEKGTIFVFAGGNGGANGANVNYNGYANSMYTIAVGAISDEGKQASYSTPGAALVVSAPSSSRSRQGITTTDLTGTEGLNSDLVPDDPLADEDYTSEFGGTSSASPLVSGVIALMLEANPELGWRDVQEILIRSAALVDPDDKDWTVNTAGFHFNHKYGAGIVDAAKAVELAESWTSLPSTVNIRKTIEPGALIPDNDPAGVTLTFNVTEDNLRVEHVLLNATITHAYRGDLALTLISPGGTESRLAERHGDPHPNYDDWTFATVRDWGEDSQGVWTLRVADLASGTEGIADSFRLEIYGTSAGPSTPQIAIAEQTFDDSVTGNGNGLIDLGERIAESIRLKNLGAFASGVSATLSTTMPGVTILRNSLAYPDIDVGGDVGSELPFEYEVDSAFPCGQPIEFVLEIDSNEATFTQSFSRQTGLRKDSFFNETVNTPLLNLEIPDKDLAGMNEVTSSLDVNLNPDYLISDVDVGVRIDHTFVGDLRLEIEHPDGTSVVLAAFKGNSENYGAGDCGAFVDYTLFDNDSSRRLNSSAAPFTGTHAPDGDLSQLEGKPVNGTWKLHVLDDYELDVGTLLCWELRFVTRLEEYDCSGELPSVPPDAFNMSVFVPTQGSRTFTLIAQDLNGDAITYEIVGQPVEGTITGFDPVTGQLTYETALRVRGEDTIVFRAKDADSVSEEKTVTVSIDADIDRDGLPDSWELSFFGTRSRSGEDDPDEDGLTNAQEFAVDTDPSDFESVLLIDQVVRTPGGVELRMPSADGRVYQLLRSAIPGSGVWSPAGGYVQGTGEMIILRDVLSASDDQFYYLVRLVN